MYNKTNHKSRIMIDRFLPKKKKRNYDRLENVIITQARPIEWAGFH